MACTRGRPGRDAVKAGTAPRKTRGARPFRRALPFILSSFLLVSLVPLPAAATVVPACDVDRTPFNFELLSHEETAATVATLAAGRAYVASGGGLRILDVADPAAPVELGFLPLPAGAEDVAVQGTVAYVALGAGGILTADVSDPAAPVQAGEWSAGAARRLDVAGSLLFVAGGSALRILDVSDPSAPALLASYTTPQPAWDVDASGDRAFVVAASADGCCGSLLELLVADPAHPSLSASHGLPQGIPSVAVSGSYAYVGYASAWGGAGLKVFRVGTPGALEFMSMFYPGEHGARDVAVGSGRVFLAGGYATTAVEPGDPRSPLLAGLHPQVSSRVSVEATLVAAADAEAGFALLAYDPVSARSAGPTRYDTSAALSEDLPSSEYVVLASGADYPDALAGAPLAFALGAPILLVQPHALPSAIEREIVRLGASKAIILGAEAAVGDEVRARLVSIGIPSGSIERIGGADRYQTARLIALALEEQVGGPLPAAFVATGEDFPDALAASGVAARMGAPILLTKRTSLPSATRSALAEIGAGDTIVLGSSAAVSSDVAGLLPSPQRLQGSDRYATARAVADYAVDAAGFAAQQAFVVTGRNFPDALSCGVVAAMRDAPTVLVSDGVPSPTRDYLTRRAALIEALRIVGGTPAVSTRTERELVGLVD